MNNCLIIKGEINTEDDIKNVIDKTEIQTKYQPTLKIEEGSMGVKIAYLICENPLTFKQMHSDITEQNIFNGFNILPHKLIEERNGEKFKEMPIRNEVETLEIYKNELRKNKYIPPFYFKKNKKIYKYALSNKLSKAERSMNRKYRKKVEKDEKNMKMLSTDSDQVRKKSVIRDSSHRTKSSNSKSRKSNTVIYSSDDPYEYSTDEEEKPRRKHKVRVKRRSRKVRDESESSSYTNSDSSHAVRSHSNKRDTKDSYSENDKRSNSSSEGSRKRRVRYKVRKRKSSK